MAAHMLAKKFEVTVLEAGKEFKPLSLPLDKLAMFRKTGLYFDERMIQLLLPDTVREIYSCEVRKSGPKYVIIVRGNGFLYKMVRSIAGFLLSVGKGNEKPEAVCELLESHEKRSARVETAPARGLFLWKVFYRKP